MLSVRTSACLAVGVMLVRLERLPRAPRRLVAELRDDLCWLLGFPIPLTAWRPSPTVSITRRT